MSWIENIERMAKLQCGNCGHNYEVRFGIAKVEEHEDYATCPNCQSTGVSRYKGFRNVGEIGITKNLQRTTYDQNGRKAVRIGNTYMSKSKHHFMETGKVEEFNTKEYDDHTIKQAEKFTKGAV